MTNGSWEAIIKVIAYGVPALLIICGFIAVMSGKFAETIFGTSEGLTGFGVGMILIGITIYLIELFLKYGQKPNW